MAQNIRKYKKWFSTADMAEYCEVGKGTVRSWIRNGTLRAFQTPTGHYRIGREQFINFVKEQGYGYNPDFLGSEHNLDILIIEDDTNQLELMSYLLDQLYPQMKIETATNGFDGYMKLHHSHPRLVILDLNLPEISGLNFLRIVREQKEITDIKIIVASAFLDDTIIDDLAELNVDGVMSKPIDKTFLKENCDKAFLEV